MPPQRSAYLITVRRSMPRKRASSPGVIERPYMFSSSFAVMMSSVISSPAVLATRGPPKACYRVLFESAAGGLCRRRWGADSMLLPPSVTFGDAGNLSISIDNATHADRAATKKTGKASERQRKDQLWSWSWSCLCSLRQCSWQSAPQLPPAMIDVGFS